jgi:hypothetical protein
MLEKCTAHLLARTNAQTNTLEQVARASGFGQIRALLSRRQFETSDRPTKLNFFLAHHGVGRGPLVAILRSVRVSTDDEVRFAPVILFSPDVAFETYLDLIRMGFDDVVTLPERPQMIVARLSNQVEKEQLYFETTDYFGPDRRRMELGPPPGIERSTTPHSHTQHVFRRNADVGVQIVHSVVKLTRGQDKHIVLDRRSNGHPGDWPIRASR